MLADAEYQQALQQLQSQQLLQLQQLVAARLYGQLQPGGLQLLAAGAGPMSPAPLAAASRLGPLLVSAAGLGAASAAAGAGLPAGTANPSLGSLLAAAAMPAAAAAPARPLTD